MTDGRRAGRATFSNSYYLAISANVERLLRSYTKAIAIMNSSSSSDNDGRKPPPSEDRRAAKITVACLTL